METSLFAWPPDYPAEFRRRIGMVERYRKDPILRTAMKSYYAQNCKAFINDFCITYNPRNKPPLPKTIPFLMFRKQEDFVDFLIGCLGDKENGLVEKCRDIGATWLCCAFSVWLWLFMPGASVGWGSRKESMVDQLGNMDSIFEKMRVIIRNLPRGMLPKGFEERRHATYMKIINPETGAAIIGEAGDNIGRGGRSTIYFKDESAHYERPELIEAALGDNTDVQIDISSVRGTGNVFYKRRRAGEEWLKDKVMTRGKTRVFIFDWRDHPGKTQEWYDLRLRRAKDEGLYHVFAQEVDRDYAASVQGVVIPPKWVKAAIDAHLHLNIPITGERVAGQDICDEGGDKHALVHRTGVVLQYAEHWGEGDGGDAARVAVPICTLAGIEELYYDSIGVGASFKSETNRLREAGQLPKRMLVLPWNASSSPLNPTDNLIPGDIESPKIEDFFENLKVQGWWSLRTRFEKTYKMRYEGVIYPHDELISLPSTLPNIHVIEEELSQAVLKKSVTTGRILIDKKPDGTTSPNLADSIVICYHPTREVSILDVLD